VSTLAHVFEAAGLSTVVITPMRFIAEKMKTPRSLYAEFPLGLPLGKPRDAKFQRDVLRAAFALLERPEGPVLEDFPESIQGKDSEPLVCLLPPRFNPDLHPAVDEAKALRSAYDRAIAVNGRTSVGRVVTADEIPSALEKFVRIANGEPWDQHGFDGPLMFVAHDIRTYYEELVFEITDSDFEAWGAERWFYEKTEAGKLIFEVSQKMKEEGAPPMEWYMLAPGSRH
jgi:hypothetical protein